LALQGTNYPAVLLSGIADPYPLCGDGLQIRRGGKYIVSFAGAGLLTRACFGFFIFFSGTGRETCASGEDQRSYL